MSGTTKVSWAKMSIIVVVSFAARLNWVCALVEAK